MDSGPLLESAIQWHIHCVGPLNLQGPLKTLPGAPQGPPKTAPEDPPPIRRRAQEIPPAGRGIRW
eukprot:13836343-Alexandrium_andersonii.AAC.1